MAKKVAATFALGEIPHKQCLVHVPSDTTGVVWHQRVLILPSGRPDGRWIAVRPDLCFEILDLQAAVYFVPLSRGERLPPLGPTSTFSPVDASTSDSWVPRARVLADALHFGQDDEVPGAGALPRFPPPATYQ